MFPSETQNESDFSQLFFKSQPIEKQGFVKKRYGVTVVEDAIPVTVESHDKVLNATVEVPDDVNNVSVSFIQPDGTVLGPFDNLMRPDGFDNNGALVHDNENQAFNDLEIDAADFGYLDSRVEFQDAYITRDTSNRTIKLTTVFDSIGEAKVVVHFDGVEVARQSKTLTTETSMDLFIEAVEEVVSNWQSFNGLSKPSSVTLSKAGALSKAHGNSWWRRGLLGRITRSLIGTIAAEINIKTSLVKGVYNGMYDGIVDDGKAIAETAEMLWSPYQTYCEIKLMLEEVTLEDFQNMIQNSINNLLSDADKSIEWQVDSAIANDLAMRAYVSGYTFGYLVEQAAVMMVGVGVVNKAGKIVKTMAATSKTAAFAVGVAAAAKRAKLAIFKFATTKVRSISEMSGLTAMLSKKGKLL